MDKREFIQMIVNSFPSTFKDRNMSEVFDEYNIGIKDGLDYDKLYSFFVSDYDKATAPRPAFFKQYFEQCAPEQQDIFKNMSRERRAALVELAKYLNSEKYVNLLYKYGKDAKALPHLRELFHKYNFQKYELNQAMISGQLG